jgi:hypothetical protein
MMRWSLIFRQLDVQEKQFEQSDDLTMDDIVLLNIMLAAKDAFLAGEIQKFAELEE